MQVTIASPPRLDGTNAGKGSEERGWIECDQDNKRKKFVQKRNCRIVRHDGGLG